MRLPENHVLGPGGAHHRSATHKIPVDQAVQRNAEGSLSQVDTTGAAKVLPPATAAAASAGQPQGPGWVAWAGWLNEGSAAIRSFSGSFAVPAPPEHASDSVVFLFLGLQKSQSDTSELFQPVLQWGSSAAGGGAYWGVCSWYLCQGTLVFGDLVRVEPGERLDVRIGEVVENGQPLWEAKAEVLARGVSTRLRVLHQLELAWAYAALETYADPFRCTDYPDSPATRFEQLALATADGAVAPSWSPRVEFAECATRVDVLGAAAVDIVYRGDGS